MLEQLSRMELESLKFPRLYVDYVMSKVPPTFEAPTLFGTGTTEDVAPPSGVDRESLWNDVLEYNSRLGASESSLDNIRALALGEAVPVLTGQQPGLFGGPLYTLYKVLTAASLSERPVREGTRRFVPVLWNASDDSDFEEVSSASFFDGELSRKTFSMSGAYHSQGRMVGSVPTEAVNEPFGALLRSLVESSDATAARRLIEDSLRPAGDLGEFFSALFLRIASASGIVVVDARLPSVSKCSRDVLGAYLKKATSVEREVVASLKALTDVGYSKPVSASSAEVCVFLKEGEIRKKVSPDELSRVGELWEKGEAELVPNVLLGPILRNELLGVAASVLGPSEVGYTFVTSAVSRVLGFRQTPVFPRLSMTVFPRSLTVLVESGAKRPEDVILAFDEAASDYVLRRVPENVEKELARFTGQVRSAMDTASELASASGRSTEDVTASARRKIDFELQRVRDAFLSVYRKRALAETPVLRQGREFLSPKGTLQERIFCCLAPLVYSGESFVSDAQEVARTHVRECLEGRVHHYVTVADIP
ncbi:MAG: hypothetical protein AMJ46_05835 [Latescibacteria bacterium DG_63]|nr:MAG: hypothetical protein AMJ46_05835 [Latescibacteria bacterium DG_63]